MKKHPIPEHLLNNQKRITKGKMASEYGKKGGAAGKGNKNVIIARKLQWLKKKGLTDESAKQIYDLMLSHDMSSLDILMYIKKMQTKAGDNKEMNAVAGRLMDWHKLHHGDKKTLDVKMLSINLNEPLPEDLREKLLEDIK